MMNEAMFRFMNIRPPQATGQINDDLDAIDPHGRNYRTELRDALDLAVNRRDLPVMIDLAVKYLGAKGVVASLDEVHPRLVDFDMAIAKMGTLPTFAGVKEALNRSFDTAEPDRAIQLPHFRTSRERIADLLVALFYVGRARLDIGFLVHGMRLLELVERMAYDSKVMQQQGEIDRVLRATVVIPYDQMFLYSTLPSNKSDEDTSLGGEAAAGWLAAEAAAAGLTTHVMHKVAAAPAVPTTHGRLKVAGVGDLLIVRQALRRYEAGEIAHVENALAGEFRERSHRRTETTDVILTSETETTSETERDLQSTDRFELQSAASRTLQEDMSVQAGLTVTASYGTVQVSATGQFGYSRSKQESEQSTSTFARDVTQRSVSRVRERVLERRETRKQTVIEEINKHGLNNTGRNRPVIGIYRWLDKVYDAQVINYGKRMMIEFLVPEPAAYYRSLETKHRTSGLRRKKPEEPNILPQHIHWPDIQEALLTYGVTEVEPPPAEIVRVTATLEVAHTHKEQDRQAFYENGNLLPGFGATKVSAELEVPPGYISHTASWSRADLPYVMKWPKVTDKDGGTVSWGEKDWWSQSPSTSRISIGSQTHDRDAKDVSMEGISGKVPIALITSAAALVVTVELVCKRTPRRLEQWQLEVYEQILLAYQARLQEYYDDLARLEFEQSGQIQGRNPAANRDIERMELKRASISILTAQHFDLFDALQQPSAADPGFPLINFEEAAAEGDYVQFFEQSFEWRNMTYVYYPYFWGRKSEWEVMLRTETSDPLFNYFLKAGYARVQVPIRPGFETMIIHFLSTPGGVIWQSNDSATIPKPYLAIVKELQEQFNDDFTVGEGSLKLTENSAVVGGEGTKFTQNDVNREIRIDRTVYVIREIKSPDSVTLAKPYTGKTSKNVPYALGGLRVGDTWEVRLPTTLVVLNEAAENLPEFSEQ